MSDLIQPNNGLAHLEATLGLAHESARRSLERAEAIDAKTDATDQDFEYDRALAFMKVTAKVGLALARLKSEHSVHIHRTTHTDAPPRQPRAAIARGPADAQTEARINKIYSDWVAANAAKADGDAADEVPDDESDEERVAG